MCVWSESFEQKQLIAAGDKAAVATAYGAFDAEMTHSLVHRSVVAESLVHFVKCTGRH